MTAIPRALRPAPARGRPASIVLQPPLARAPAPPPATTVVRERSAVNPLLRAALYLAIFSIPFEMPKSGIPIEVPTFFGALFLLATLIQPSVAYRRIPAPVIWFTGYLWIFGLSTLVNRTDHAANVLMQFLLLLQVVLMLWTSTNLMRERRVMRGAFLALALACAVRAGMQLLGIAVTATELWTGGARISVFGQNPNLSALILSAGFIIMLNLRPRMLAWPLAAMIAMAIIQTGSRGGLFSAVGGLLVMLLQGQTLWSRIRNMAITLVALALLAVGVWSSDMLRARFLEAAEKGAMAGRERIYPATIEMISEKPLLGWGPTENQYEIGKRIGEMKKDKRDAHDLILELMSATGILGTIPFLIGLGMCIRGAWRGRRGPFQMLPFALLVTVLIGCLGGTWQSAKIVWTALAIGVAAGAVVREREKRPCAV